MPTTAATATLRQVADLLDYRYDPLTADAWDRVGLVCGDPDEPVERVLFAVDPADEVVTEAIARGAQLVVTHHPLLLSGVHGVPADDPKGRIIHRLIRSGIGLLAAHTNADNAESGVSDAIAIALGVADLEPLEPIAPERSGTDEVDKFVVMVPVDATAGVLDAMASAGAGRLGDYDRAAFWSPGTGTFRPLPGANPTVGAVGQVEEVAEDALQMVAPRARRSAVVRAMLSAHPYEEPAFDVIELAQLPRRLGGGRVGGLAVGTTLGQFADRVADVLPATAGGVRVAGRRDQPVRRVAVCGGAGDSLLGAARAADADVYVTSDLRHHRAGEHLAAGGCALIDVAHWAAEWMWLPRAAKLLEADSRAAGLVLETTVSTIVTDPWTFHVGRPFDAR